MAKAKSHGASTSADNFIPHAQRIRALATKASTHVSHACAIFTLEHIIIPRVLADNGEQGHSLAGLDIVIRTINGEMERQIHALSGTIVQLHAFTAENSYVQ